MTRLRRRRRQPSAPAIRSIIDAVSLLPEERRAFADIAARGRRAVYRDLGSKPMPTQWRNASASRRGDASDATAEVLARQLRQDPGPIDWIRIDARGGREAVSHRRRVAPFPRLSRPIDYSIGKPGMHAAAVERGELRRQGRDRDLGQGLPGSSRPGGAPSVTGRIWPYSDNSPAR